MPIEQVNGAFKRVVRKSLSGSTVGLAELCIDALVGLDANLPTRFSRKSFYTLRCYATRNWDALKKTTSEHKRRRTRHKPSSQASNEERLNVWIRVWFLFFDLKSCSI